jgi:hypothetical protein
MPETDLRVLEDLSRVMNWSLACQELVDRSSRPLERESMRFRTPEEVRTVPISKIAKHENTISSNIPGKAPPFV